MSLLVSICGHTGRLCLMCRVSCSKQATMHSKQTCKSKLCIILQVTPAESRACSAAQETSAEASLAVLQAQAACMKTVTGTLAAYCLSSLPCRVFPPADKYLLCITAYHINFWTHGRLTDTQRFCGQPNWWVTFSTA